MSDTQKLSQTRAGDRGVIVQVGDHCHHDEHAGELERRLLELGFVEGARMLGVDPARSVAVEDAISGVQSAAAGGFALVIGVDRGTGPDELRNAGAHLVVDDLAQLVTHPSPRPDADGSDKEEKSE